MKKPHISAEKPLETTKTEPAVAAKPVKAAAKKTSTAGKTAKPVSPKTKDDQAKNEDLSSAAAPQKSAAKTAAKKTETVMSTLTTSERVGLTAGNIWNYLSENGATSVSKLITELMEEEKIIQRSIGWLAQENKITIDSVNRVETITLI
ncbi:winged helix-turn-helix domain-containing protein [Methylomonas sp. MgM2]